MLRYGLSVQTPTMRPDDDPWKPVLQTKDSRLLFDRVADALRFMDRLQTGRPTLKVRLESIDDGRRGGTFRRLE
jgi:hypothetical protein